MSQALVRQTEFLRSTRPEAQDAPRSCFGRPEVSGQPEKFGLSNCPLPWHVGRFWHAESGHNRAKPAISQNLHFSYIQPKIAYNKPKCSEWNKESIHAKIMEI